MERNPSAVDRFAGAQELPVSGQDARGIEQE
jgi:hypothetical protein